MGDETMIGEEGRLCLPLLFAVKAEQKFGSVRSAQGQHSSYKYCSKTLKRKWGKRGRHVQWIVPLKKRNSINNFDNNISVLQEESPVLMRAGVSTDMPGGDAH
jgi:hypothetical protein